MPIYTAVAERLEACPVGDTSWLDTAEAGQVLGVVCDGYRVIFVSVRR